MIDENFRPAPVVPELYCTDLAKSLWFYVDVLGFHVCYDRPERQFAYLEREGAQFMIQKLCPERSWVMSGMEYPFGRGINFEIGVSDVDALCAKVQEAGIALFQAMEESWYRAGQKLFGCREFLVQDPDGYLLRFSQHIGEKPIELA